MPTEDRDAQPLYEEMVKLSAKIQATEKEASIMFIDLAGSTEFKYLQGSIVGLQKTYIHNSLVTKLVAGSGEVTKYIGDEVMVLVKDRNHPALACQLAKAIQNALAKLNKQSQGDIRFPIESKIGIHSGRVQYWKYSGHDYLDPQGTAVDVAARITSLAKPQQILCSDKTSTESSLPVSELGPVLKRYVKGIRDSIGVCEILWDGHARNIGQNPVPVPEHTEVRQLVREGRERRETDGPEAAVKKFEAALQKAPVDFEANFRLGELLARYLDRISEGRKYLNTAKTINPSSAPLLKVEGFLEWQEFQKTATRGHLDAAITLTEECLRVAELTIDNHSAWVAQGNLAYYLIQRNEDHDLSRALRLCESTYGTYNGIETREMAGFLDTYALALLTRGEKDPRCQSQNIT
jgi:class 3 adenylate cyclase